MSFQHNIVERDIVSLRPYARHARKHSRKKIRQLADLMQRYGIVVPIVVSDDGEIITGYARCEAAKLLGRKTIPALLASHLTTEERQAFRLADNKLVENATWDEQILAGELQVLIDLDFEMDLTGFSVPEIDAIIIKAGESDTGGSDAPEDDVPAAGAAPISRRGDLWMLGGHRLLCGDAQCAADFARLLGKERADLLFTDPPYNVPIDNNVCGLGAVRHREFAYASGEMSRKEFTKFLSNTLGNAAAWMRDGTIAYIFMDWRHLAELEAAGRRVFSEMKNLIVWNKTNGGMGTFYRSKHELIFVFKAGTAPHTNNFGLGETGRYRTNVWDYAGISSIGPDRAEELAMHPTVKPVALVADAILDCSRRGGIVLDCFGGSGSTLIAAEKTGRKARLIEYDPIYCDTIIRRWQKYTCRHAQLAETGEVFEDVAEARSVIQPTGEAA